MLFEFDPTSGDQPPFSYLILYCLIVNESSGPKRVTHHIFYSVHIHISKHRVILTIPHRISNPKSLISLQPTKAFMRLSWCVSGIWGWEVFTTAHKVILAATSPSQMGNIAFILRGAAPQIWISQKWCVTRLGAKNPRLGWDIRRRVHGEQYCHFVYFAVARSVHQCCVHSASRRTPLLKFVCLFQWLLYW